MNERTRTRLYEVIAAAVLCGLLAACSADTPESLLTSAKGYLAKNDRKAAVIQLKNALVKDPNVAEARFLLGRTLLETDDVRGAEKELTRARDLKYPAAQVDPPLASAWVMLGEYKKVADEFSQAQGATPRGTAELKTAVGQSQLALGKPDLAKAAFADAQRADPSYAPALIGAARLTANDGDLAGALQQTDKAIAADPASAEAWQFKGDLLFAQKQTAAAVDAYHKVVALKPGAPYAHGTLISALVREGKLPEANQALDALKAIAPKDPQTYYYEALVRAQEKNYKAARDAIQQQLALAPDNPQGTLLSAAISYELHDYERAADSLTTLLQRTPANDYARRLLVGTLLQQRQPAKALDVLEPMLGRIGDNAMMQNMAGEVYLQNGEAATAAGYFEKAAVLDPAGARQKAGLALTRLAEGDTARGIKELEAAAAVDTGTRSDLMLIAVALREHQWDNALTAIDALEKKEPGKPLAPNLRGLALLGKNDAAGARKSFERALTLDPAFFPATANLARLDLAEKKPKDAQQRFEDLVAKNPGNSQALLALAQLREGARAPSDEVVGLINKAIAASPKQAAPRLALMQHYLRVKDAKKAVLAGQDALTAMPGRPEILDALGRSQQAAGDSSDALTTFGRFAEVAPDSPLPYLRMAALHGAAGKYDAAEQSFRRALAIKPDLVEAQRGLVAIYLGTDRAPDALALAKDVQKQRPKEAVGYILEGDVHASKRDWPKALAAYRSGVDRTGTSEAAIKLHATLVASGQGAEAQKMSDAWLRDHPADDGFRFALAELAGQQKDYAGAMKYYRQLIDAHPDNAVLFNNFAWVAGQAKDPRALEYAEKANTLAPNQAGIMDTLGTLLVERGDGARGLDLLRKATQLAPTVPAIRINFARSLIRMGQKDEAKKELDELAKLGDKFPDHDEVARLRKGI